MKASVVDTGLVTIKRQLRLVRARFVALTYRII